MLPYTWKVAWHDQTRTQKTANHKANWQATKKRNVKMRKVHNALGRKSHSDYLFSLSL
jgi:hypothetical protein